MSDYNTYLQTAAAISSAIAAIAAVSVARSTFAFQKNSLVKKASIEQIIKVLSQLHYLKSLTGQAVLASDDSDFIGLKTRILETRENVMVLEAMLSPAATPDLRTVRQVVQDLREENAFAFDPSRPNVTLSAHIDDAIRALQNIYQTETK